MLEGAGHAGGCWSCWRVLVMLEGAGHAGGCWSCWRVLVMLEGAGHAGGGWSCWRVLVMLEGDNSLLSSGTVRTLGSRWWRGSTDDSEDAVPQHHPGPTHPVMHRLSPR